MEKTILFNDAINELHDSIINENFTIFMGAGVSKHVNPNYPVWSGVTQKLKNKLNFCFTNDALKVAQKYENKYGYENLKGTVKSLFPETTTNQSFYNELLKIGENTFNIMSRRPLAHGGNQKVEEVIIAPSIEIYGEKYDNILLKKNFFNELIDLQSLTVFQELITRKIPTVKFLIEATINGKPILVTENLNKRYKDTIYVSSNYHSENYLIRALISSLQNKPMPLLENNSNSMEYFLSKNKLSDIKNIDDVIAQGNLIAEKCYRNNIFFPEDAIFFGVNLINQTIDDILLVDYGSVLLNGCCDKIVNFEAIRTAIEEFKMHFVH